MNAFREIRLSLRSTHFKTCISFRKDCSTWNVAKIKIGNNPMELSLESRPGAVKFPNQV